jgi:hypothetical protein
MLREVKKRIATDMDETLFDMMTPFKKVLMKRHNARVVEPQTEYNIKTYPEVSDEEIWDIFKYLYDAHILCEPCPGARSYLTRIYQLTQRPPIILTSRPFGWESQTHAQMKSLLGDIPYHLIIVGTPADKKLLYKDEFDILVDDRLETLLPLVEHHKKEGILIKRPWNRQFGHLPCPTDNWFFSKSIIEVGGVLDIIPFLPLLIYG